MILNLNKNPQTYIIVCYNQTNVCDPTEIENVYENINSTIRKIPKYNVLIIAILMLIWVFKMVSSSYCMMNQIEMKFCSKIIF